MEGNNEEQALAKASNETLSDIQDLTIQCRGLFRQLSTDNTLTIEDGIEGRGLMASFKMWTAEMGVFDEGQQSFTSRLKSIPKISKPTRSYLDHLKRDLEKVLFRINSEHNISSTIESDDSSNRSSTSSRRQPTVWTSTQDTIASLWQFRHRIPLALRRLERVQHFKVVDRNKQVYQLFERCARQKLDHLFPNASEALRGRMAVSIGIRRARFQYLKQHQKKTLTLSKPALSLQENSVIEGNERQNMPEMNQKRETVLPSEVSASNTIVTKLDPKRSNLSQNKILPAESVSSVKIFHREFPPIPKLDPGVALHRSIADTYASWCVHMRYKHTQAEWHCFYCKTAPFTYTPFSNKADLESHLEKRHQELIPDSLRPTTVEYSKIRQHALQECPFCGGFPKEIEKKHPGQDRKELCELLNEHVRDHLIDVALIMAPFETGELGNELDDAKSEAQRDNDSECDVDRVGDTYEMEDIADKKTSGNETDSVLQCFAENMGLNQLSLRPSLPLVESPNLPNVDDAYDIESSTKQKISTR
ncbi:hypothetical protein O1611_g1788 [Lasiodiplodia mahajangana]|uniref:Uncharacterized protein n=1 Tax=Lasiodiplodia mahajangana TaxID=1108764 RepID=A0ACC2JWI7_9PEZI|nr:hypothetical protein O1611_g1788 [Lasiodiplodia mahajangana]